MRNIRSAAIFGVLLGLLIGCGKPAPNGPSAKKSPGADSQSAKNNAAPEKSSGPAAAVFDFLEAVRTGNDEKAAQMLSALAREKTAALNRNVTPPASDTARFTVGKVERVGEGGARVASSWTDLDDNGEPRTDEALWMVRLEKEGWRIVGVGVRIFPDEPLLLLNFENPEEMFRKQQWAREEILRRMNEDSSAKTQARDEKKPNNPIRR
ncbi:MAG: hypothetical protein JW959_01965 [Pirellulales bacterium]|nr:hypothetical protein [Pirellulales bacterium]